MKAALSWARRYGKIAAVFGIEPVGKGVLIAGLVTGAVALGGCGSSHTSTANHETTTTTTKSSTTTTRPMPTTTTPTNYAALEGALSRYAACMRSHGVDIPPPSRGPGGKPLLSVPKNTPPSGPLYLRGLAACKTQLSQALALSG